jgi:dTDP-4-amino-4,6-dideoxygalactose transaminase
MRRTQLPFVDLAAQRTDLRGELERACLDALTAGEYILGPDVDAFEHEYARFCGVAHGVGVDSGTSALELALRALGIGPGDEVITAASTFVATTLAIIHTGARPVLVDVDRSTYTIDPGAVAAAVTPRTQAIVPVHLYGQCADMEPLLALARRHGLAVVEDACQAHGARHDGRRAGSLGDAAAFSFYPSKNLGAAGDGGMVVTRDADLADRLRLLRNYGQRRKNHSEIVGHNRRLDTLQAAILRAKLSHLDDWNEARRSHAASYDEALADMPVVRPAVATGNEPVWHLYVIRAADRDTVRDRLAAEGIETGVHYPVPVHLQPSHRSLGYGPGDFPISEQLADEAVSLPMYPELPGDAGERVAAALYAALDGRTVPVRARASAAQPGA